MLTVRRSASCQACLTRRRLRCRPPSSGTTITTITPPTSSARIGTMISVSDLSHSLSLSLSFGLLSFMDQFPLCPFSSIVFAWLLICLFYCLKFLFSFSFSRSSFLFIFSLYCSNCSRSALSDILFVHSFHLLFDQFSLLYCSLSISLTIAFTHLLCFYCLIHEFKLCINPISFSPFYLL